MSDQPKVTEPVPVQLTRIEGTVNLIAYQLGDLVKRVDRHDVDISDLKLAQAAANGSSQSWAKWIPIIISAAALVAAFAGVVSFK